VTGSDNLLEVRAVAVSRGERRLIEELSFSLASGQRALVIGPNGGGKTSFLRTCAGLAPCAAGEILFRGVAVDRLSPEQRAKLAYRGHQDGLKKDLTIRENIEFYSTLQETAHLIEGALDELGLKDLAERQVRYLSAGQRRRVGLAVLRVCGAQLWILDEPMTNLDADGRRLVSRWLDAHVAGGGIALVATHQHEELTATGSLLVEI
jgi:heme exporter protein A